MAISVERVQKVHPEPGCKHYSITFIDEDTGNRTTLEVHERAIRRRMKETLDKEELLDSIAYYVGQKGLPLIELNGKVIRPDVPANRTVLGRIATFFGGQ